MFIPVKIPILTNIFQMGWKHQLVFHLCCILRFISRRLLLRFSFWSALTVVLGRPKNNGWETLLFCEKSFSLGNWSQWSRKARSVTWWFKTNVWFWRHLNVELTCNLMTLFSAKSINFGCWVSRFGHNVRSFNVWMVSHHWQIWHIRYGNMMKHIKI